MNEKNARRRLAIHMARVQLPNVCQHRHKKESLRLVKQTFHEATDKDEERVSDIFNALLFDQTVLERFAYRCEGFFSVRRQTRDVRVDSRGGP